MFGSRHIRTWICGALLLAGVPTSLASDIVWGVNHVPPFHILEGEHQHQGICDALVQAFINASPHLEHEIKELPTSRLSALIQNDQNVCLPCMILKPADQSIAQFSDPTNTYPPHGIITRPELAEELTGKFGNPIDIEALVLSRDYSFGQPPERKFGRLQGFLDQELVDSPQFSVIGGSQSSHNLFLMLRSGRIDYTIDYLMMKNYIESTTGNEFVFIPIQQNKDDAIVGAVGCSKNAWGTQALELINEIIPIAVEDPVFRDAYYRWLQE